MPGQRAKNQRLIAFALDYRLLAAMDRARGNRNRSQFVRDALLLELQRLGVVVDPAVAVPPDRVRTPSGEASLVAEPGQGHKAVAVGTGGSSVRYERKKKGKPRRKG